ncbi:MAG: glycosyl hydrolase family 28 protein [Spirochaetales bacterium]
MAFCEKVKIQGVTIQNPPDSPNTDGINPDSCKAVQISDCFISVGDDCIAIKSGMEEEEKQLVKPCESITISNCQLERGHGGIVLGSETTGGIRNVVVSNCLFKGTDRGIRIKTRRGRGGGVEHIRVSNCIMEEVLSPFTINMFYGCGAWGNATVSSKDMLPVTSGTPKIRSIFISHVWAYQVKLAAAFLYGLPESPIKDLHLSEWAVELDSDYRKNGKGEAIEMAEGLPECVRSGFYAKNVEGIYLSGVQVRNALGNPFYLENIRNGSMHRLEAYPAPLGGPLVACTNVEGIPL